MELWIRSKNRRKLSKINHFELYDEKIYGYQNYSNFGDNEILLGKYKTKERALEILDEIEKLIKPQIIIKKGDILEQACGEIVYTERDKCEIEQLEAIFYQMPEE